ncbi:MAG: hypothetical protein GY841_13125 [FCB group bacterium]|nr:hypothetical protein [FCB group bacterium]
MSELDVPIIKKGIFNQLEVRDLQSLTADTIKAMPYLIEAQKTGLYRGEGNARFNGEPIPPFIHVKHFPDNAIINKFREWASDVEMDADVRLMNAEEWGFVKFRNVDPELAQLLAEGFPYRSGEFLPNFENPDTGEVYPVVLRSVAFLGANTEPAVPQQPGYSVKLAQNEQGVTTIHCNVSNTNQSQEEIENMPNENEGNAIKLSQDDIQKLRAEFSGEIETLKAENATLKGVVNDDKAARDALESQVHKLESKARAAEVSAILLKLEKDYDLTPAAVEAIRPIMSVEHNVVKMSADAEPIPVEKAYVQTIETVLKLAKDKGALFVPTQTAIPTGKQEEPKTTEAQREEAAIVKMQKDATERGETLDYADARLLVVKDSNAILDLIAQTPAEKEGLTL